MDDQMSWFSRYWDLGPEERREFLEYASTDADLQEEALEIKHFEDVLAQATEICRRPLSDDALLFYAQRSSLDIESPAISRAIGIIEHALSGDAEAMKRYQRMKDRMEHFEENVPGTPYDLVARGRLGPTASEPVPAYRSIKERLRPAAISITRQMAVTVLTFVIMYAGMMLLSGIVTSNEVKSAYLASDDTAIELLLSHERGDPELDDDVARILDGANLLRQSQVSTLGLFRRYDPAALAAAAFVLDEYAPQDVQRNVEPFAAYFLAKLYLAQGKLWHAQMVLNNLETNSSNSLDVAIEDLRRKIGA